MSAKRNSPDVDDEADSRVPSAKRLHRVVFEAVKIPAVSTVVSFTDVERLSCVYVETCCLSE